MLVKGLKKISNLSIILLKECDFMAEKRIQKVFYYSNKIAKSIIEGLLDDEAEVTNRSTSYLIEQHILRDFLPENETVSKWIQMMYAKDDKDKPVSDLQDTMIAVFSYMAAGVDNKSKNEGGKPLVDFAYKNKCLYQHQSKHYDKSELPYYHSQLGYVIERIEMMQKGIIDETLEEAERKAKLDFDIRELKRIHEEDEITDDSLSFVYMMILDNWDMLFNWTYTYRLLTGMARIQTWEDSAETRMNLVSLLNDFAKNINKEV